jgi:biotin carboxylase
VSRGRGRAPCSGVTHGVTHTEVRLTPAGPCIFEVNGRLGGGLIPYLGRLAPGVDLTAAAVRLALGELPDLRPCRDLCAAVRFRYPPSDARVTRIDVSPDAAQLDWLDRVVVLAGPGTQLRLPPRGLVSRYAAVVVTAGSEPECRSRLYQAELLIRLSYTVLD